MVNKTNFPLLVLFSFLSIGLHSNTQVSGLTLKNQDSTSISSPFEILNQKDDSIPEGVEGALSQAGIPSKSTSDVERTSSKGQAEVSKTGEGGRWGKTKLPQPSAPPTSSSESGQNNKENKSRSDDISSEKEEYWTWKGGAFGCLDGQSAKGPKNLCSASIEVASDPFRSLPISLSSNMEKPSMTSSQVSSSSNPSSSSSSDSNKSKSPSSSSSSSKSTSPPSAARRAEVASPTLQPEARSDKPEGLMDMIGIIESALSSVSSAASVKASQAVQKASQMAELSSKSNTTSSSSSNSSSQKVFETSSMKGNSSTISSQVAKETSSSLSSSNNGSVSTNSRSKAINTSSSNSTSIQAKSSKSTSTNFTSSPLPTSTKANVSKLARRQEGTFTGFPTTTLALSPSSTPTYETLSDLAPTFSSSVQPSGRGPSGNGDPPADINNLDSPDLPWLDLIVGGVPYKNGDLAASIVWILATFTLVPLFLIRLFRRSSLISMVLFTILIYMILLVATFGIRAYISNNVPTTPLMIAENAMLSVSIPLLTEPLLHLLGLYASQGTQNSGVPVAAGVLRFLNFVALLLYVVAAAYMGIYLKDWDNILSSDGLVDPDNLPKSMPVDFVRIAPIVASFFLLIIILGGLLLLPVAKGESKNNKPGGFLAILFVLLAIPVIFRILQTLHASAELKGDTSLNPFSPVFNLGSPPMRIGTNRVLAGMASNGNDPDNTIPPGMYNPMEKGIAWSQLQQTMASRGAPQTPLIFNLVYILPQWLMVFLFFFVHAPGNNTNGGKGRSGNDTAKVTVNQA